jgi:hypothetical protein
MLIVNHISTNVKKNEAIFRNHKAVGFALEQPRHVVTIACSNSRILKRIQYYAKAVLKSAKLNTVAQQIEAVTRGQSLLPYRLRYNT